MEVLDQLGDLLTSDNSNVTLAANSPAGVAISGTDTIQVSGGMATFSNVILDTAGNYTLVATDGSLPGAVSDSFTISPAAAAKLVFVQQPVNTSVGATINPAITVNVEDEFGNIVTGDKLIGHAGD